MPFVRDDLYEEMALAYQCHIVALLEATLERNGIMATKKRRKIVESFLFQLGIFHDQGWFRPSADAEKAYPLLCFTETFLNTDTPLEELGDVLAPSAFFGFQEYAVGTTEQFYDNDPDSIVETGIIGACES